MIKRYLNHYNTLFKRHLNIQINDRIICIYTSSAVLVFLIFSLKSYNKYGSDE